MLTKLIGQCIYRFDITDGTHYETQYFNRDKTLFLIPNLETILGEHGMTLDAPWFLNFTTGNGLAVHVTSTQMIMN